MQVERKSEEYNVNKSFLYASTFDSRRRGLVHLCSRYRFMLFV